MITHFLTIRRYYDHLDIIEDREYYYNNEEFIIAENKYYRNPYNFEVEITGNEKLKKSDPYDFVLNLVEMIHHSGIIYEDLDFIKWYAKSVHDEDLKPIS